MFFIKKLKKILNLNFDTTILKRENFIKIYLKIFQKKLIKIKILFQKETLF